MVEPELVLYGLLPPLLFAAAIRTPLADVRARRDSILLLSVGLVAFTALVVGFTLWWLAPAVGLAAAFAFGFVLSAIRKRLRAPVLDTSLSLVIPYLAFIPAQVMGASGVLAVVVTGLMLGNRSPLIQSAEARIAESINWRTIRYLLENAVFLFIGLSLAGIVAGVRRSSFGFWEVAGLSVVLLVVLVLARFGFVAAANAAFAHGPRSVRGRAWGWKTVTAVSSAGIRGVVTLAAVFLLPERTPERELLQILAFVVVVGTLAEGLALPRIIRGLRLPPPNSAQERVERRLLLAEAQTAGLERLEAELSDTDDEAVIARLRVNARFLAEALENPRPDEDESPPAAYNRLRRAMIVAEREAVLTARAEGRYQGRAVRAVLATIDAEEIVLRQGGHR